MADSVADFGALRSAQLLAAPLHPTLVHFPIALTTACLVAAALERILSSQSLSDCGFVAAAPIAVLIR